VVRRMRKPRRHWLQNRRWFSSLDGGIWGKVSPLDTTGRGIHWAILSWGAESSSDVLILMTDLSYNPDKDELKGT